MSRKSKIFLLMSLFAYSIALAQNVGIGTITPNASAKLDIVSTNQGLLPPRLTFSERNSIVNPAAGLIIWCSTCGSNGELQVYNGSTWQSLMNGVASDSIVLIPVVETTGLPNDGSFGGVCVLSNSPSVSFSVLGNNLTAPPGIITISSPSQDFQVSNDNATWGGSTTTNYSSATLGSTLVYVRFTPQTEGFKECDITINGGGISSPINIHASGTGYQFLFSVGNSGVYGGFYEVPSFGALPELTTSTSKSYKFFGNCLQNAPGIITVTAPSTDFQVSNDNVTWGGSTTISYSSSNLDSTLVYVRFVPQTAGFKEGNITINVGGIPSPSTAYVSGTGFIPNPPNGTGIVISQVYGGGGGTYHSDYVELHNNSGVSQSLSGMSIQYASASNISTWSGVGALPAVNIPSGGYFLIQMNSPAATGADPIADYILPLGINMSATNGRVALVNGTTALFGCPSTPDIIDLVGYGTSSCFESPAAAPALNATTAAFRNNNGCNDTNNNNINFSTGNPAPRNSISPVYICSGGRSNTDQ
jgi:hypothetical protein